MIGDANKMRNFKTSKMQVDVIRSKEAQKSELGMLPVLILITKF